MGVVREPEGAATVVILALESMEPPVLNNHLDSRWIMNVRVGKVRVL